jgi:hypothetical protein
MLHIFTSLLRMEWIKASLVCMDLSYERHLLLCASSIGVPTIPMTQGGHWSDTRDLCHAWWGDPSGPSVGHGTPSLQNASYPSRLGAMGLEW